MGSKEVVRAMDMRVRSIRDIDMRGWGFLTGEGVASPMALTICSARASSGLGSGCEVWGVGGSVNGMGGSEGHTEDGSGECGMLSGCIAGVAFAGDDEVSSGECEVKGVASRSGSTSCWRSTASWLRAVLGKVECWPISVASESAGVAVTGTCHVGRKTGSFSKEDFFCVGTALLVRAGLVGASGMDSDLVFFLLRTGERELVVDVRRIVSEIAGLAVLAFDTCDSSSFMPVRMS